MPATLPADYTALLWSVLDAPDDDAPRLVYADWLDEHGEPERAEFIRVQIELARPKRGCRCVGCYPLSKSADRKPCRPALRSRERTLLNAHGFQWAGPAAPYIGPPKDWPQRFRRGFVAEVHCSGGQLAAVVDALTWPLPCTRCQGEGQVIWSAVTGRIHGTHAPCPDCSRVCQDCKGSGRNQKAEHHMAMRVDCPTCHGHGRIPLVVTAAMQPVELVRLTSIPGGWEVRRNAGTHSNPDWADMTGELFAPNIDRHYPRRRWTLVLPDGMEIAPAK